MTYQVWELLQFGAIWAEIICAISNGNGNRFEITSMISDQNCTSRGSITTLLHPFDIAQIQDLLS